MTKVTVLMTCYNRKAKTEACIRSLHDEAVYLQYIVTDDGSSDGTREMLAQLQQMYDLTIVEGDGTLFWCGGMIKAMEEAQNGHEQTDYYALVNDDVAFLPGAVSKALEQLGNRKDAVLVGTMCNQKQELTYGGVRFRGKSIRYDTVKAGVEMPCDTFNCNFVLIPAGIFEEAGIFDRHYRHAMADFDYGLKIRRLGYHILNSKEYLGICERNSREGTWVDSAISRKERLYKKEAPKGLPAGEWFYYLKKNFGLVRAVWHSVTPYLKIALGK